MRVSAVTFFAGDVDALAAFYGEALGLEQTVADPPRYRELGAGGANIGIAYAGAYDLLGLGAEAYPSGLRGVVTFSLDRASDMADAVERAVAAGAVLVRAPYVTHFGATMAVLRDPEDNAFRLAAISA